MEENEEGRREDMKKRSEERCPNDVAEIFVSGERVPRRKATPLRQTDDDKILYIFLGSL